MPIGEHEELWRETPTGTSGLSRLEKLRVSGETVVSPEQSLAPGVGVFKTTRGHYLVFRGSRQLVSAPALDLLATLSQSTIPESEQARIRLQCDPPGTDLELAHLFDQSLMLPDEIREYRLHRMAAEDWDI